MENCYVVKDGKKLRCGFTTGSCAAAAAKAAAIMLFSQEEVRRVDLQTPKGVMLHLPTEQCSFSRTQASCSVRKDAGDDPDVTDGLLICACVARCDRKGETQVRLEGGRGVGRVTRPGLEQPVGDAAINKVPRAMICREVEEVCARFACKDGIRVVISVPGGEEAAAHTFNPRLGIEGGISILGTGGLVIPMSEEAFVASIRQEMEMKRANGARSLLVTPGNYGEHFLREKTALDVSQSMKCSNYVGETLDLAAALGFEGILFVAHIGKFIKVSGGIMNTHSRSADARAELLCAHAIRAGADLATARRILQTATTEEAVTVLEEASLTGRVMKEVCAQVRTAMQRRVDGAIRTEAVLFSNRIGYLGETQGAQQMMENFRIKTPET